MQKILIYLGDEQHKKPILENVLTEMNLNYEFLDDDALTERVGYLMGLSNFKKNNASRSLHVSQDLMILSEISDDEIIRMNKLLKDLTITMSRKAMLTEHNKDWFLCDLLDEIKREHAFFQKRDELYAVLKQSSELMIDEYSELSWKRYADAFANAYEAISKGTSYAALEHAQLVLHEAKEALEKRN